MLNSFSSLNTTIITTAQELTRKSIIITNQQIKREEKVHPLLSIINYYIHSIPQLCKLVMIELFQLLHSGFFYSFFYNSFFYMDFNVFTEKPRICVDFSKRCCQHLLRACCCGPEKECFGCCNLRNQVFNVGHYRHVKDNASGIPL